MDTDPRTPNPNETWHPLPDYRGYEISSFGRVRSWKQTNDMLVPLGGKRWPTPIHAMPDGRGSYTYRLDGEDVPLCVLEAHAELDLADTSPEVYAIQHRQLTTAEMDEIVSLEGVKPAYAVAEEFNTDSSTIRGLWDSTTEQDTT